jgi:hypothetical protein
LAKVSATALALLLAASIALTGGAPATAATKKSQKITWSKITHLRLSAGSTAISARSSSKLSVKATSNTPAVCKISAKALLPIAPGACKITLSQAGNSKFKPVKLNATVSILDRYTADQPDTIDGWQIHPVYVQPADSPDRNYDTNGHIDNLLDEGNAFLKAQLNNTFNIDSTPFGYDITYLKSVYTAAQIMNLQPTQITALMRELNPLANPGENRKDYVFFIDVPELNSDYCGWADRPGLAAVVAINDGLNGKGDCTGPGRGLKDYAAKTWVHEVFHNLGVKHNSEPCDLMYSGPTSCSGNYTIDVNRRMYVKANASGVDVMTLRVWKGYTLRTDMRADCLLHFDEYLADGATELVYCPLGSQPISATSCYSSLRSVELEQLVDGNWQSLEDGYTYYKPWGAGVDFECTNPAYPTGPWQQVTVTSPQTIRYRWVLNDYPQEPFDVVFVR